MVKHTKKNSSAVADELLELFDYLWGLALKGLNNCIHNLSLEP